MPLRFLGCWMLCCKSIRCNKVKRIGRDPCASRCSAPYAGDVLQVDGQAMADVGSAGGGGYAAVVAPGLAANRCFA